MSTSIRIKKGLRIWAGQARVITSLDYVRGIAWTLGLEDGSIVGFPWSPITGLRSNNRGVLVRSYDPAFGAF